MPAQACYWGFEEGGISLQQHMSRHEGCTCTAALIGRGTALRCLLWHCYQPRAWPRGHCAGGLSHHTCTHTPFCLCLVTLRQLPLKLGGRGLGSRAVDAQPASLHQDACFILSRLAGAPQHQVMGLRLCVTCFPSCECHACSRFLHTR